NKDTIRDRRIHFRCRLVLSSCWLVPYLRSSKAPDRAVQLGVGMNENPATLGVQVAVGPDADAEEVAKATLQLRRELLDLDVDAVEALGAGKPPSGSKAMDVATLGALVVHVADSQMLAAVVAVVRSWLAGSSRRSVKLQLGGDALEL